MEFSRKTMKNTNYRNIAIKAANFFIATNPVAKEKNDFPIRVIDSVFVQQRKDGSFTLAPKEPIGNIQNIILFSRLRLFNSELSQIGETKIINTQTSKIHNIEIIEI